jgi:small subunit ribosomal protein S17
MGNENKNFKRKLEGVVTRKKMEKTITVSVVRKFKHSKYAKFVHETNKYHAHDSQDLANEGDRVLIIESKPHSKLKKWELVKVFQA